MGFTVIKQSSTRPFLNPGQDLGNRAGLFPASLMTLQEEPVLGESKGSFKGSFMGSFWDFSGIFKGSRGFGV